MAYENLKLKKRNFTADQGYFYMFDQDQDSLLQKTDDGNTAFTYPFDTLMTAQVLSAEHDGVYFWSLEKSDATAWVTSTSYAVTDVVGNGGNVYECIQDHTSDTDKAPGTGVDWETYWVLLASSVTHVDVIIKQWKLENYLCKLQNSFTMVGTLYGIVGPHLYDSEAFSVEHYHTTLNDVTTSGSSTLYLNEYSDHSAMNFTTTSGNPLTIHLGPNSGGEEEDVQVNTTISGGITIVLPTSYTYADGDPVNFYTYLWLFNDYNGVDSTTGALYKIDAYTNDFVTKYPSGAYKDITAATFYNVDSFTEYGAVDTLAYIKSTNMLFVNTEAAGATLPYYGSMVMDNVEDDEATIITVYDLAMDDQNVYRMQLKATYYDSTETWTYYSYQLSSLDAFVTSISLAAYPAIIAANQVSTSDIEAIVKDQFLQPIVARLVYFTDDNTLGDITGGTPKNTDSEGKAQTVYTSGNDATEVKITAVVEQT
jgi:hypothetical protein